MDHHCNHISLHCFRVFAFLCLFATLKWSRLLKMTLLNFPKSKGAILDRFWFPSSFPCFALVTLQVPTWYKSKNNWTCRHSIWMLYLMWTTPRSHCFHLPAMRTFMAYTMFCWITSTVHLIILSSHSCLPQKFCCKGDLCDSSGPCWILYLLWTSQSYIRPSHFKMAVYTFQRSFQFYSLIFFCLSLSL